MGLPDSIFRLLPPFRQKTRPQEWFESVVAAGQSSMDDRIPVNCQSTEPHHWPGNPGHAFSRCAWTRPWHPRGWSDTALSDRPGRGTTARGDTRPGPHGRDPEPAWPSHPETWGPRVNRRARAPSMETVGGSRCGSLVRAGCRWVMPVAGSWCPGQHVVARPSRNVRGSRSRPVAGARCRGEQKADHLSAG